MTDRLGQQLGNYRLTRLLGQGGFAEVYLGEHILLGTTVAIKVLHAQISQEDVAQFQQEARLLASLKHPHIIRILDFGIDGQTPYLIMDYASNGTLRTRYARGTQLSFPTVVGYVTQIAEALQYAHDRKIVHRDVKPENMLIGEQGEILLTDFGIALIAQSSRNQSTQDIIGTVAYMSPEQIQGKPRPASDQYSLGIVTYEWLSGTRPFHGSFTELCTQHMFAPLPPLREKVPTISPEVEQIITTALAKDPKQRFGSTRAFATALEQASHGTLPAEQSRPVAISSPEYAAPSSPSITAIVIASPPPELAGTTTTPPNPMFETQTPPARSNLSMSAQMTDKPTISRRAILIGASAGGVVIVAAGGAFLFSCGQSQPGQPVTKQKPTTIPQGQLLLTYRGHSDRVDTVVWSLDGKRIASGSEDSTAKVWNASDGSTIFTYTGHSWGVYTLAWSPDGQQIASGSYDQTVQVWNASDGSPVFTYTGHSNYVYAVAWSPDGQQIASSSQDKTMQVWNASDGSSVFTYTGGSAVWSVAWSPDGKRIASGSDDGTVQVWNASDGSHAFTYRGHSSTVQSIAWSPDGKRIASGSLDQTVQVWDASDGSHAFTYRGQSSNVFAVAWSPDGKRIASGSGDQTVQVWDASDGSHAFTYRGHSDTVQAVAWSPDGQRIVSSYGAGSGDNTVQVWQAV